MLLLLSGGSWLENIIVALYCSSVFCANYTREATNTNFIVFGLIQLGLKPMIYHTPGEHANNYIYTTEAFNYLSIIRTKNTAAV
jgi:hypothetical protein